MRLPWREGNLFHISDQMTLVFRNTYETEIHRKFYNCVKCNFLRKYIQQVAGDNFETFIEANIVYNMTLNIQLVRRVSLLFYSTIHRRQLIFTVTVSNLFIALYAEKLKFTSV